MNLRHEIKEIENIFSKKDVMKSNSDFTQSKKQIEVISTFLPDVILNMKNITCPEAEMKQLMGVILSVTISDLFHLSEKFNRDGTDGTYKLTTTLNAYIGAIVEIIHLYGGDLLNYSKDSFLILWVLDTDVCLYEIIHKVIVCALLMQEKLGTFETDVDVTLKMKLAMACGTMIFSIIGNNYQRQYVILGDPVIELKNIEHFASYGDIIIAPCAWGHVSSDSYKHTVVESGAVKVTQCLYKPNEINTEKYYIKKQYYANELCDKHISHKILIYNNKNFLVTLAHGKLIENFINSLPKRLLREKSTDSWLINDIKPFIIKPIINQVDEMQPLEFLSGMKEITVQFINIVPNTYNVSQLFMLVNKSYEIVCYIVSERLGIVNKFFVAHDGIYMEIIYGVKERKYELCCRNALKSSFLINQQLTAIDNVKTVTISITNGYVYCGIVGHPHRRQFLIIGNAIRRALNMITANPQKITCDEDTYNSSRLPSSFFQLQAGHNTNPEYSNVFQYKEHTEDFPVDNEDLELIDRQKELDMIHLVINHTEQIDLLKGVCIKGKQKVGKTYLLRAAAKACYNEGHNIATVDLEVGSQRPYFCASLIYRQLYDKRTINENIDLCRELWSYVNEIHQDSIVWCKKTNSKEEILKKLIKVCEFKNSNNKKTALFIDNVQNIDSTSLATLLKMLNEKNIRLICTGQFENEATWDLLFKFSLNDHIKVHEIKPLNINHIPLLISNLLHVDGVGENLLLFIQKCCDGRPGWIENWLVWLQSTEAYEIKYIVKDEYSMKYKFPRCLNNNIDAKRMYSAVELLTKCEENSYNLNTIALDLFNSLSPYQQLVIKTASTFDEIFMRSLLSIMLGSPKNILLSATIQDLFEKGIFNCGSKYFISGNLFKEQLSCSCIIQEETYRGKNLPKYAFCQIIHFNNKKLKESSYELLPENEKKEMHLKIIDFMDELEKSCPKCSLNHSVDIINLKKFKFVKEMCLYKENVSVEEITPKNYIEEKCNIEELSSEETSEENIKFGKIKDSSECFCLELLIRIYADLVRHSEYIGCLEKKLFFLLQYGISMLKMNEIQEAIAIFTLIGELFEIENSKFDVTSDTISQFIKAILHSNLADAYVQSDKISTARNHILIAFKNYNIPFTSIITSCIGKPMVYSFSRHKFFSKNSLWNSELSSTLYIASNIFVIQGDFQSAAYVVTLGLELSQCANENMKLVCDMYCKAIRIYIELSDRHMCEKLQNNINNNINIQMKNNTIDFYFVNKVFDSIFQSKLTQGLLSDAIKIGFGVLELNYLFQWCPFLCQFIPNLIIILLFNKRIDDAVHVGQILYNLSLKYDEDILVLYYTFCLELMLESNYYLDHFEKIQIFADKYIVRKKIDSNSKISIHENALFILLFCYYTRHNELKKATAWKMLVKFNCREFENSFRAVMNLFKYTECSMEILVKNADLKNNFNLNAINELKPLLDKCYNASMRWKVCSPRYFHFLAYFNRIRNKQSLANTYIKQALKEAENQENHLEMAWCTINNHYWKGGFSFTVESKICVDWKLSYLYNLKQWSQILYPLSIQHFP